MWNRNFIYELKISYVVYISHNGNYIYQLKMSYVICFSYVEISYMKLCEMEISYMNWKFHIWIENFIYELKISYVICFSYMEISYMKLCEISISHMKFQFHIWNISFHIWNFPFHIWNWHFIYEILCEISVRGALLKKHCIFTSVSRPRAVPSLILRTLMMRSRNDEMKNTFC